MADTSVPSVGEDGPLIFGTAPFPAESLIGLVARATQRNWLSRPAFLLEPLGMKDERPGYVGLFAAEFAPALAAKIGCGETEILERCHSPIGELLATPSVVLKHGDGEAIRGDLDLQRRRLSPASLREAPFHRSQWLNLLLPYCPESGELLVDHCHCGARLGWRRSIGIDRCETCGEVVRAEPHHLRADLMDQYRFFAALVSPVISERQAALAELHPELVSLLPRHLTNLILHLGAAFIEPQQTLRRTGAHNLPPATLAEICSIGASVLRDWPIGFREHVKETAARRQSRSAAEYNAFARALRTLCVVSIHRYKFNELMRSALPEISAKTRLRLLASPRPSILAKEVFYNTRLRSKELRRLREKGIVSFVQLSGSERTIAQYDRGEIDAVSNAIRGSIPISAAAWRMGLPVYAVERLACRGVLETEAHPAVLELYAQSRVTTVSFDRLTEALETRAGQVSFPEDAVMLSSAMRIFGGSEKPWDAVITAMLSGELPFWRKDATKPGARIFVIPADLSKLHFETFLREDYPSFRFEDELGHGDVSEILNVSWQYIARAEQAGELKFRASGKTRVAARTDVLALAKRQISVAEACWRLGCSAWTACAILRDHAGIPRTSLGWDRAAFDRTFPRSVADGSS